MAFPINQDILRLQVPIDHIKRVNVFNRQDHLSNKKLSNVLLKNLVVGQVVSEVAAGAQLQDHVKILGCLERVLHVQDERVLDLLHDLALADRVLEVAVLDKLLLAQDFHGEELGWVRFQSNFVDLAETTLTQDF